MNLREGQRLAPDLVLREKIAAGGQGEVWKADDEALGLVVAVKILRSAASSDRYLLNRFEQEAKLLAILDHPGLTRLFRYDLAAQRPWIALELADGATLASIVTRRYLAHQPLEVAWTRVVIEQVSAALGYAHARGIIHRDIKPSNVIVGERVRLVDFGVAKLLTQSATQVTTAQRAPVGTLSYFAPEQLESEPVTLQTDIHALGVLVFAMLAGQTPWHDPSDPLDDRRSAIIRRILEEERPPLRRFRPELSPAVDRVLARAMAIDPLQRHRTVAELASDLVEALADVTLVDGVAQPIIAPTAIRPVPTRPLVPVETTSARPLATPHEVFLRAAPTTSHVALKLAWPLALTVWGLVALAFVVTRREDPIEIVLPLERPRHALVPILEAPERTSAPVEESTSPQPPDPSPPPGRAPEKRRVRVEPTPTLPPVVDERTEQLPELRRAIARLNEDPESALEVIALLDGAARRLSAAQELELKKCIRRFEMTRTVDEARACAAALEAMRLR